MNGDAPATGKITGVLVLIERPGGGVRIQASREAIDVFFGLRERNHQPVNHVDADMPHMMTIDRPTYGEAFEELFRIWANQDRVSNPLQAIGHSPVPVTRAERREKFGRELTEYEGKRRRTVQGELEVTEDRARGAIEQ
jgi:hypothetical protein